MERHIELQNIKVPYTLKINSRSKRLRLSIHPGGSFVVTAPKNLKQSDIDDFIIKKSEWVIDGINRLSKFKDVFKFKNTKAEYAKYKEEARFLVERKVLEFNKIYNFKYNNISIKNQKTRWGSCSTKGNLNFNYKIALIPERLADYIVVHEICHLGEMNHSSDFWDLVEKGMPDYKERRRELRKGGVGMGF